VGARSVLVETASVGFHVRNCIPGCGR
jgi:hypothetical protein